MRQWLAVVMPLFVLLLSPVTYGAEVKVEGVLKAVNEKERTVTVERKTSKSTKELTFDVAEEAGDLASLKVGDRVSAIYEQTLEIVTKIRKTAVETDLVDLLKHVQLDTLQSWQRKGSILVNRGRSEDLVLRVACDGDYDIVTEVRLQSTDPNQELVGIQIGLPLLEGSPAFHVGSTKSKALAVYFPLLRAVGQNNTFSIAIPKGWDPEAWHKVVIHVSGRGKSVRLVLDDNEVFRGTAFPGLPTNNTVRLTCDTSNNELLVRRWEIRSEAGVRIVPYDSRKDAVIGQWRWFTGDVLEVLPDGKIKDRPFGGWSRPDSTSARYFFSWANGKYRDDLVMSADGEKLQGKNQDGADAGADRIR
jgi:hypothetical protein